jgi:hypothetical protein
VSFSRDMSDSSMLLSQMKNTILRSQTSEDVCLTGRPPANGRDQMRRLFILLMILLPLVACQTGCRTCRPCGGASSSGTYSEIQNETREDAIVACPSGACPSIQAVTEELRTAKALIHPDQAPLPPTPIADPL